MPVGWPSLPIFHAFGNPVWQGGEYSYDPGVGQVGVIDDQIDWDDGVRGPLIFNPTHFCGKVTQWQNGSIQGVNPPLTWTDFGYSTCCLEAPDNNFGAGGMKVGGSAVIFHADFLAGGMLNGGSSIIFLSYSPAGGAKFGGSSSYADFYYSTGGMLNGGSADI